MNETNENNKIVRKKLKKFCPVPDREANPCLHEINIETNYCLDLSTTFSTFSTFLASQNTWGEFYGIIYMLIDMATGLVYIGQTIRDLRSRLKDHLQYPSNKFLKRAFDRYGYDLKIQKIAASAEQISTTKGEFIMKVIKKCESLKELNKAEKEEIKRYKSCVKDYHRIINGEIIPLYGYNIDRGGRGIHPSYGPDHPLYLQIKEKPLIQLIMRGYFLSEIANEFNISIKTISRRIDDLWHRKGIKNISDARRYYGGFKLYKKRMDDKIKNSHHMNRIIQYYPIFLKKYQYNKFLKNELTADEIDEIILPMLIYDGYSAAEIGQKVGLQDSKLMAKRFQEVLNMSFYEARDEYFFKPSLVYLLRKGIKSTQIVDYFNQKVKKPFRLTRIGIYNAMRRIWKREYDEFTERAMVEGKWDNVKSPFDYNRLQFTHFYHYLIRIYHLYPKINEELAELLTESELSTKEVDKEFLVFLIQFGYSLEEIAKKYNSNYDVFRKWLKKVLGMNYNNAKDEYFWKPRILSLIKTYDPIPTVARIAEIFNIPDPTLRGAIKRIWKYELEKLGSIRTLLEYLKKNKIL